MSWALPWTASVRFLGQRIGKAINVPVKATEPTWDNRTIRSTRLTVALMAENSFPLGVLQAEVIWSFFIPVTMPGCCQRAYSTICGQILLYLDRTALFVFPRGASLHILKVLTNITRETESTRVFLFK